MALTETSAGWPRSIRDIRFSEMSVSTSMCSRSAIVTTADRPSDELIAMGEMISPSSPCFSTTVPSNGARMCIWYLRVYSISSMLAFVILSEASSAATRATAIFRTDEAFS